MKDRLNIIWVTLGIALSTLLMGCGENPETVTGKEFLKDERGGGLYLPDYFNHFEFYYAAYIGPRAYIKIIPTTAQTVRQINRPVNDDRLVFYFRSLDHQTVCEGQFYISAAEKNAIETVASAIEYQIVNNPLGITDWFNLHIKHNNSRYRVASPLDPYFTYCGGGDCNVINIANVQNVRQHFIDLINDHDGFGVCPSDALIALLGTDQVQQ